MQVKATKRDLEAAMNVVTNAVAGGEDGELPSHYLFRVRKVKDDFLVEMLANNGQRILASAPIAGAVVTGAEDGDAFTAPGWRVRAFVSSVTDGDAVITFDAADGITKATSPRGSGKFGSLNPKDFPFWDETLKEAKSTGKVSVQQMTSILSYTKNFISDQEARSPALVATECRDGVLQATDSVGVSLVTSKMLAKSHLRIHGKDISAVLSFLAIKGSDEVELLEHDRCLFMVRGDGGMLGVSRWMNDFPALKINKAEAPKCWFEVNTEELLAAMKFLAVFAKKDDKHLYFKFDKTNLVLSMESGSGSDEADEQVVSFSAHDNMEALKAEGYDGFVLSKQYVETIAEQFGQDLIRFGVNWAKRNGYVTFSHTRDTDEYFTLVVWVRKP